MDRRTDRQTINISKYVNNFYNSNFELSRKRILTKNLNLECAWGTINHSKYVNNFLSTTLILSALERESKSDFFIYLFFYFFFGGGGTDTNTVCQTVSNEVKYKKATIYKM